MHNLYLAAMPSTTPSRTLTKTKRNFCVTRREMLAAVEFVKRHRHYLCDRNFSLELATSQFHQCYEAENQRASFLDGSNSLLLSTLSLKFEPENVALMQISCTNARAQKHLNGMPTSTVRSRKQNVILPLKHLRRS